MLFSLLVCSLAGVCAGFGAGLIPGLHMNNIAAALTAYSGAALALFTLLGKTLGSGDAPILIACFICAALVGHLFAESVTSTYLGIPSGDVVSVLPAHRLARAGMGDAAVSASADGSLGGVLIASLFLVPVCLLMGNPVGLYRLLGSAMGFIMIFFSGVLLFSEGSGRRGRKRARSVVRATLIFFASGTLGVIVLCSQFYSCDIPEVPFRQGAFVLRSSLLLPMFAGLYGIPGLLLGLRSERVMDTTAHREETCPHAPRWRDWMTSALGGIIVGWMPGMTAGSSATLCAPSVREYSDETEMRSSLRFIWMYSSVSASGAVFAVGALFTILRARSGSMDAAQYFLAGRIDPGNLTDNITLLSMLLVSMLIAAFVGHWLISLLNPRLHRVRATMCSPRLALASLVFICLFSLALTGTRGALVMATAATLGLIPPMAGIRRIQLMGCLLVPITMKFFGLV
jgi:putative membrane protein